jgi:hypothetical protein
MAIKFEVTRPDDLLNLKFSGENLKLDVSDPEKPAVVVENHQQAAFLTVVFPPQTVAETAFFESSKILPESNKPDPDKGKDSTKNLPSPGNVAARMAHPSRLVFKVPPTGRIPFTTKGILDWSKLELSVSGIAAMAPEPTAAEIAAAPGITPPKATETALELPYKLFVSPNSAVHWAHRVEPFTSHGRTELWHTRLQLASPHGPTELSVANTAPLRAIWSEDYNNPPLATDPDKALGRTAMSPDDRRQIVILTSAFHGYEVEEEFDISLHLGHSLVEQNLTKVPMKFTVPYLPKPFFADQLMLSPLGSWLRSRGQWNPPHRAHPRPPMVFPKFDTLVSPVLDRRVSAAPHPAFLEFPGIDLSPLFRQPTEDNLDLSEWVHIATQGRDHYVRIVYEGELWPFRNRAALIKVTERKFQEQNGLVVAYLFQHMFIVVREPEKKFALDDRGMPFKRVRLTTLVTPDIADPDPHIIGGTQRSFWVAVRTADNPYVRFKFHAVGTDVTGANVDFTIPMMFVSKKDYEQKDGLESAAVEYNKSSDTNLLEARSALVPGQKLVFAMRNAAAPNDNTQLVTRALNFVMDPAGDAPHMLKADVNIPQVQELLGSDAPTSIRYFQDYVNHDFDAKTGVFAEVIQPDFSKFLPHDPFAGLVASTTGVNFSSDKAGGFATPNLSVSTLSRSLGPLAGQVSDAVLDTFNPASFFQKGMAQLFGSFDLVDLLLPTSTLGTNAPKLRSATQDIPGGKLLVATLDWEPEVQNVDLGVAAFKKDFQGKISKLLIHGRVEKPLKLDSLGTAVTNGVKFEFNGKLNDFRISVLNSVFINFKEFSFDTRSNAKPDVRVTLDSALPIEFDGNLKFVEELRKAIPPDLFGSGPSLDISPTGIRAGFAFALPPLAVGVFALKDVSLGAALTLPFLNGKPTFDFNVSERPHPFLLAVGIFGGGGFFRLQIDTAGIKVVEAAFEFGATASIDLGVASGGVHIMAGIYFKLERKESSTDLAPLLSGYLRMGGYLSVLGLIKVSIEFNLSFTYDGDKDKAYGRATLTVQVEVAFFSKSVELTVERAFGGHGGDPKFGELFNGPSVWSEYALAFA